MGADPTTLEEALAELAALRAAHEALVHQRDQLEASVAYERRENEALTRAHRGALDKVKREEREAHQGFITRWADHYSALMLVHGRRSDTGRAARATAEALTQMATLLRTRGPSAMPPRPSEAAGEPGAEGGAGT